MLTSCRAGNHRVIANDTLTVPVSKVAGMPFVELLESHLNPPRSQAGDLQHAVMLEKLGTVCN